MYRLARNLSVAAIGSELARLAAATAPAKPNGACRNHAAETNTDTCVNCFAPSLDEGEVGSNILVLGVLVSKDSTTDHSGRNQNHRYAG
jgi:hypothetical protein